MVHATIKRAKQRIILEGGRVLLVRYNLYVGLNDKDAKKQLLGRYEAINKINTIILKEASGATIKDAQGVYTYNDGAKCIENTLIIELIDVKKAQVLKIIKELKKALNQEAILYYKEKIAGAFI